MDITDQFWECASRLAMELNTVRAPKGEDLASTTANSSTETEESSAVQVQNIVPKTHRRHSAFGPDLLATKGVVKEPTLNATSARLAHALQSSNPPSDPFLFESNRIVADILALAQFVQSARKPYLGINSTKKSLLSPSGAEQDTTMTVMGFDLLIPGGGARAFTPSERDQLDTQCRMLISKCRESIRRLEVTLESEKRTLAQVKTSLNPSNAGSASGLFSKLLGRPSSNLSPHDIQHQEIMLVHYTSIVWCLNQRLFRLSTSLRQLQEKQLERDIGALPIDEQVPKDPSSVPGAILSEDRFRNPPTAVSAQLPQGLAISSTEPNDQRLLQELETENAALYESYVQQLDHVRTAESSLLAIAQLQTELAQHLAVQAEHIETLHDDAQIHVDNVTKGNLQLLQVRDSGSDFRFWFLFILLVLSGVLLFLDWYAGDPRSRSAVPMSVPSPSDSAHDIPTNPSGISKDEL